MTSCIIEGTLVDAERAYQQVIERGQSQSKAFLELVHNSIDAKANEIEVDLVDAHWSTAEKISTKAILFYDNGVGMSHDKVIINLFGACFDDPGHQKKNTRSRNGGGFQGLLTYFHKITVETTTKGMIPKEWSSPSKEIAKNIEKVYKKVSKLKPGDPDTEIRRYEITRNSDGSIEKKALPFIACDHDDSFTKIYAEKPPLGSILINHTEIRDKLAMQIDWLSNPDNSLWLKAPQKIHSNSDKTNFKKTNLCERIRIKDFFSFHINRRGIGKPDSYYCHVQGSNKEDSSIRTEIKASVGKETRTVKEHKFKHIKSPIEYDIWVTKDVFRANLFTLSICGVAPYSTTSRTTLENIRNLDVGCAAKASSYPTVQGWGPRVHGYIRCDDIALKNALVQDKMVIHHDNPAGEEFLNFITNELLVKVCKVFSKVYRNDICDVSETFSKANNLMNKIMQEQVYIEREPKQGTKQDIPGNRQPTNADFYLLSETKNHKWLCEECKHAWKVPLKKQNPKICPKCGKNKIARVTIKRRKHGCNMVPVPSNGNFVPVVLEDNVFYVATCHPVFMMISETKNTMNSMYAKITEHCLYALAIREARESNVPIDTIIGPYFRRYYHHIDNKRYKKKFKDLLEANKLDLEDL